MAMVGGKEVAMEAERAAEAALAGREEAKAEAVMEAVTAGEKAEAATAVETEEVEMEAAMEEQAVLMEGCRRSLH